MQQRLLILSVCLIQFFCPFMGNSLNIAVPALSLEYATAPENITWVINVYMIATASFLLPATALANYFGYRNLSFSLCRNFCRTFKPYFRHSVGRPRHAGNLPVIGLLQLNGFAC